MKNRLGGVVTLQKTSFYGYVILRYVLKKGKINKKMFCMQTMNATGEALHWVLRWPPYSYQGKYMWVVLGNLAWVQSPQSTSML